MRVLVYRYFLCAYPFWLLDSAPGLFPPRPASRHAACTAAPLLPAFAPRLSSLVLHLVLSAAHVYASAHTRVTTQRRLQFFGGRDRFAPAPAFFLAQIQTYVPHFEAALISSILAGV
ncbi:hypothetical protein FB451DRAFT_1396524 [Mycena latifolia]|nr:hypothetical protein FB451DRAFT_1396524 [Mycena latifolia]